MKVPKYAAVAKIVGWGGGCFSFEGMEVTIDGPYDDSGYLVTTQIVVTDGYYPLDYAIYCRPDELQPLNEYTRQLIEALS